MVGGVSWFDRSGAVMDGHHADEHEDPAEEISDQRPAVYRASLGREDVEDRLADQKTSAQDGDRRRACEHPEHEHGAGEQHLDALKQRVRRHQPRACAKSATISSAASIPTETRTVPGPT